MINKTKIINSLLLISILILAASFRLQNLKWDNGQHLHPDERFLVMVNNDTTIPSNFSEYLSPEQSPLNPRNAGKDFFVYGNFPLILNKYLAVILKMDNYAGLLITGRFLSAFIDLLAVVAVFKIVLLLESKYKFINPKAKYFASLFYATLVIPIQQAHFFTTDIYFNSFCSFALLFILKYKYQKKLLYLILSSILFGFALSSKISSIFFLPLLMILISQSSFQIYRNTLHFLKNPKIKYLFLRKKLQKILPLLFKDIIIFTIYLIFIYITIRITDPYMFASSNLLDPKLEPMFIQNLQQLKSWEGEIVWFPPAIQWLTKPAITYALQNIVFIGFGLIHSLIFFVGSLFLIKQKKSTFFHYLISFILIWSMIFFIYQSSQFTKCLRYFILLTPLISIISGISLSQINFAKKRLTCSIIVIILMLWPLAINSIYLKEHTRITASKWIYQNIPEGSSILNEAWDDGLPLNLPQGNNTIYINDQIPIYDPDTLAKWQKISQQLKKADYYILSSQRAWGSIPTAPHQYPQTSEFYEKLFNGELGYAVIKEFTSFPSLKYIGIPFEVDDTKADESFSVYDHPKVIILKNMNKK